LFGIVLTAHLVGLQGKLDWLAYISKPMIVLSAAGYFFSATASVRSAMKTWIGLALLFSLGGDVLLLFQERNSLFFLLGLSSFLLAHVFYILFFHKARLAEGIQSRLWTLLIVAVFYTLLISFLNPWLGDMRLPVRVYGVVISFMLMLAMHMLFLPNREAGRYMLNGALLFVLSDSVLAINKFYQSFNTASLIIMLTYGFAQLLLVMGAASYINSTSSSLRK